MTDDTEIPVGELQRQATTDPCLVDEPVFLVGAERSGSTLLRLMLDHHPLIAFHFEFDFAVDMIGPNGELPPIQLYHDYLAAHRIFLQSRAEIDFSLDYRRLVRSFLIQKRNRDRKKFVGATVHHAFDRLPTIWPHARYIHLVRDGRDVGMAPFFVPSRGKTRDQKPTERGFAGGAETSGPEQRLPLEGVEGGG